MIECVPNASFPARKAASAHVRAEPELLCVVCPAARHHSSDRRLCGVLLKATGLSMSVLMSGFLHVGRCRSTNHRLSLNVDCVMEEDCCVLSAHPLWVFTPNNGLLGALLLSFLYDQYVPTLLLILYIF